MTRVWLNQTLSSVRIVLDLIRQGDQAGEFHLVCTHSRTGFPGFLSADETALEPSGLAAADYVEFCLEFSRERRIDVFWPGKEVEAIIASRERFAELGVQVLATASPESLAIVRDKGLFYADTRRCIIPPPDVLEFRSAAEFEIGYARLRTTHEVLCIKPTIGINGAGFRVIDEQRGGLDILLQNALYSIHLEGLRRILATSGRFQPMLLMEFLSGPEYSVDCVGDGRRLLAHVQRMKSSPGAYGQRIVAVPAIEQAAAELTASFGLCGLFNVQFREGCNGIRLLEINARFSGGIGYTGAAGINLPDLALRAWIRGLSQVAPPGVASGGRILELLHYRPVEDVA